VRSSIGLCDRPVRHASIRQGGVALALLTPGLAVTSALAGASRGAFLLDAWSRSQSALAPDGDQADALKGRVGQRPLFFTSQE
jgi:1,6-anhydro-N-acetylmuramate kinase